MAVISIRLTELGDRLIAGIPFQVSLDTNVPSTMFYTLDGSSPSVMSNVYVTPIILPTSSPVNLKVIAISGLDTGSLDVNFSKDSSHLPSPIRTDGSGIGIAVDAYGVENVVSDGYGLDDLGRTTLVVRSSDYEDEDLEIQYSTTGPNGIGPGTMLLMGTPGPEQNERHTSTLAKTSSPNNRNVNFDPRAQYVVIDGRDGYEDMSVFPITRPHSGTMDKTKYLQGKTLYEPQPYISGGFVRTLYNQTTKTSVSYYFDHNETRWIKSIQSYADAQPLPNSIALRSPEVPLIFKWVYNKRSMI